jgi:glycosyltransferase involved in cell wall biosynthesis
MPRDENIDVYATLPVGHVPHLSLIRMGWLLLTTLPTLVKAARRADVVHSLCDYPLGFLAVLAARLANRPVIVSGHGTYSVAPLEWRGHRRLMRWMFAHTDRFVMGADFALRQVEKVAAPHGAEVVPYGVVPEDYDEKRAWGETVEIGQPYVLCVGEVKQRKGYSVSLPAFLAAWKRRPELHYAVVGRFHPSDQYFGRLKSQIDEAGAADHVHFLGNVTEARKVALMRSCRAFMLTPIFSDQGGFEAFGLVFLEAGAAGRPVVGCYDSGAEDAITDGENGFLCRRDDIDGLAAALVTLVDDPGRADAMGAAGRSRALGQTWQAAAERVRALYDELLAERPAR